MQRANKQIYFFWFREIYDHEPDIECSLGYVDQKLFTSAVNICMFKIYMSPKYIRQYIVFTESWFPGAMTKKR